MVVAGHLLDGAPAIRPGSLRVSGVDAARRAVDSLAKAGAAFIKVYSRLSEQAFRAAADQAKKNGLHFAGHVPNLVTVDEAVSLGMRTIEHLQQFTTACSSRETELRQQYCDAVAWPKKWDSVAVAGRAQLNIQQATFDAVRCAALASRIARSETWLVPTFTLLRSVAYLDDTTLKKDPRLVYLPKPFAASWDPAQDFPMVTPDRRAWPADRRGNAHADAARRRSPGRGATPVRFAVALLLATVPPARGQPAPTSYCVEAHRFMIQDRRMAAEVERDTVDDWRTGRKPVGCRVTGAGVTTEGVAGAARRFYERLRAAGWTRTPDPRDAPNEASLRYRKDGVDCLFNVYRDGTLLTDAELRVSEARIPGPGEERYGAFAMCIPAAPAARRDRLAPSDGGSAAPWSSSG